MTDAYHSEAGEMPDTGNQRVSLRVRLQVQARAVLPDLTGARNIMVRDLSRSGARLSIGDAPDLPKVFYLLLRVVPGAAPYRMECVKRWQVGEVAGVRFTNILPEGVLEALTGLHEAALTGAS